MSSKSAHRLTSFMQRHRQDWEELEDLIQSIRSRQVTSEELGRLGRAYRKASAQLAYAQTYFPDQSIVPYLNGLVSRAHQIIYATQTKGDLKQGLHFFTRGFPALFHERAIFFLIALFLFVAGAGFAFGMTWADPNHAVVFLPPEMAKVDPHAVNSESQWDHAMVSGQIMTNNIQVAILCFALGALLGIGTVWVLFMNGLLIGSLAAIFHRAGEAYVFWAYIWPHGVIELVAIFIAGAAGLSLAYAFWVPGDLTRMDSFKREGKVTVQLVLGVIPLFIIAGLIEGFITPAPWPHWIKYIVALITLIALFLYFSRPVFGPLVKQKRDELPPLYPIK